MTKSRKTIRAPSRQDLAGQPAQLELFRMVGGPELTNAFDFYESIPRFYVGRWDSKAVKWNADGTTPPLKRQFSFAGKRYRLTLEPAFVEKSGWSLRAQFPGVREEIVEFVIYKLALEQGYFYNAGGSNSETDNFVLLTSLYAIHEQLKRRGADRGKSKSYSYDQIREALLVLSKTKVHLKSEDGDDDLVFSPIADFGFFNKGGNASGSATVYIRFNALISKQILARWWRQINYDSVMTADKYLVRWLHKMLSLRFVQAAPNRSFNIKLSTIIENSGITLYDRLSDNLKQVEQALGAMDDVVSRYTVDKSYGVHPATGRGRVLADAKIILWPTNSFSTQQIKTNLHSQDLDGAVTNNEGQVVLEPQRDDFDSYKAFEVARINYLRGMPVK